MEAHLIVMLVVPTILGMGVCELRNLYIATICFLIQGIFLTFTLHHSQEVQSVLLSITSLVVVFLIICLTIKKTKSFSEEPFVDGLTSASILLLLLGVFGVCIFTFTNLANIGTLVATLLFVIGVYTMLAKADLVKLGLGLALLNNATHTLMIGLGIEFPVIVEVSLTIVKIVITALVMGLVYGLYKRTKSLDVRKLVLLRW